MRLTQSSIALAIAVAGCSPPTTLYDTSGADPHKPKPRSKGEKARNKKYRRH